MLFGLRLTQSRRRKGDAPREFSSRGARVAWAWLTLFDLIRKGFENLSVLGENRKLTRLQRAKRCHLYHYNLPVLTQNTPRLTRYSLTTVVALTLWARPQSRCAARFVGVAITL